MEDWNNSNNQSTEQQHLVMMNTEESSSQHSMLPMPSPSSTARMLKKESLESPYPPSSSPHGDHNPRTQQIHHVLCAAPSSSLHHNNSTTTMVSQASVDMSYPNGNGHGECSVFSTGGPSKSELICGRYQSVENVVMSTDTGRIITQRQGQGNEYHPSLARRISSYESCSSPDSPDRHFCSSTTQSNGDISNSIPEENGKEECEGPKRLCLVCGDTASGFHYGVASCEACKAFFKRTIQGNIEYTCPATNDCEINKRRRKACQACRFQKCLRMGMLKEGVRLDRVRGGRQKYRRNSEMPYPIHHVPPKKPTLEENKILAALLHNEPELPATMTPDPALVHNDVRVISILSDLYDKEIISTIGWAKQVPGFTDLTLNDQMRLLQSTWTEILTLSLAFRSISTQGRLTFASDFTLDEKQARDGGVYELYQPCFQVFERFERIGLLKEEYCLLKALVLVNADTRIDDLGSLKKLRETVLTALFECSSVLRPGNAITHVNMLLMCLPILRQADLAIKKFWLSVRREGKVLMNKLFVEMLEAYFR